VTEPLRERSCVDPITRTAKGARRRTEEAAAWRAAERTAALKLLEHHVGCGNKFGIAANIVDTPGEVARVAPRDLRNRAAGVSTERKNVRARQIE
jgi:hypothetical protein